VYGERACRVDIRIRHSVGRAQSILLVIEAHLLSLVREKVSVETVILLPPTNSLVAANVSRAMLFIKRSWEWAG
jgi:hypothetical protein